MKLQEGIFKSPTFYKWFYIIFVRGVVCLPIFILSSILIFMTALETDPIMYEVLLGLGLINILGFYALWVRMGRVLFTIPYRHELVSRAMELKVPLSQFQRGGYFISKTKRQIEEAELELQKQAQIAEEERKERERERAEAAVAREAELQSLLKKLRPSSTVKTAASKGTICIGMHEDLVAFIYGESYEQKREVTKKGERMTCKFGPSGKNRMGNMTYQLEVKFLDGVVDSFKDL
jgi:hypothetical protein